MKTKDRLPCRTKILRTKLSKYLPGVKNIVCLTFQYKSHTKIGQKCRIFGSVSKILSDTIFCETKILSDMVTGNEYCINFTDCALGRWTRKYWFQHFKVYFDIIKDRSILILIEVIYVYLSKSLEERSIFWFY